MKEFQTDLTYYEGGHFNHYLENLSIPKFWKHDYVSPPNTIGTKGSTYIAYKQFLKWKTKKI